MKYKIIFFIALFSCSQLYAANLPDLRMAAGVVMSPAAPISGQPVLFSATIANNGTASTPANTPICVTFYVDSVKKGTPVCTDGKPMWVGQSITLKETVSSWTAYAGVHDLFVKVNADSSVLESDTTNNAWGGVKPNIAAATINLTQNRWVSPRSTNSAYVTWGGKCQDGLPIKISGADTGSVDCVGTNWVYYTKDRAVDGAYSYTFTQDNNYGSKTSVTGIWNRDSVPPVVTLLSHNGAESLPGNSIQTIKWSASDAFGIAPNTTSLYYSIDSGNTWKTIIADTANTGSYSWQMPAALNSTTVKIRVKVSDNSWNEGFGKSSAVFTIRPTNVACESFHPGHQIRVSDDNTRGGVNGLNSLQYALKKDIKNFTGFVYQINWGMLETKPGEYDWSRIDQALALVSAQKKYLRVKVMDRTFWSKCTSDFVPSYIPKDGPATGNSCFSRIWEKDVMDKYIALVTTLAKRYATNPYFMGLITEETAITTSAILANPLLVKDQYAQLKRLAVAVHTANPKILFTQHINWPLWGDQEFFNDLARNMVSMGGGGAIGWPDSQVQNQHKWNWFQVGRDFNDKLVIDPSTDTVGLVESTDLATSMNDHEAAYQMLSEDIGAHIIVWDTWNSAFGDKYFTDVVIPLVNSHNGQVKNMSCPY